MKKSKKPKRLNLYEIWKLYLLLKPALDNRKLEETLEDELSFIIQKASPQSLLECLYILYDNIEMKTPSDFYGLFVTGLIDNDFFEFCGLIRGLNGTPK